MHNFITGVLVYLSAGALIWVVLDGLGIIDNTFARRNAGAATMVMATVFMIVGWPVFIGRWLWGVCTA